MDKSPTKTRTLAIVKPEAMREGYLRPIQIRLTRAGFQITRTQIASLTRPQAEEFYTAARGTAEFEELVRSVTGGMLTALILEREDAVAEWLRLMGDKEPRRAASGTIRRDFTKQNLTYEALVHGAETIDEVRREIEFFFGQHEAEKTAASAKA